MEPLSPPPDDAGLVRIDEQSSRGIALALDGNARYARLDPYAGAQLNLAEAYRNVAVSGAVPLAVTNCLNFGSPEEPEVMWQFAEAVRGLADACRELGLPVTGGNVSLYNQTGDVPINPTPVIGVLGVHDDVRTRVPTGWRTPGETVLLLGATRPEFGGSAWASVVHGHLGGRPPAVDLPAEKALGDLLAALGREGLLRERRPPPPGALVLCSNDYLGLARAPDADAADPPDPSGPRRSPPADLGAGASRLVSGERPEHLALERDLAAWLGAPAALAFSSGYAANLGLLSALAGPGDVVVSDALNHASIVDGCRLSRARVAIVAHRDAGAVERALAAHRDGGGRRYVVTESYFSMDGDSPDLPALRRIADAYGAALLVDEAHALGVFGPEGRGLAAARGVRPDALVGAFGKALGAQGAFVAGSADLVAWLWNRARPFVFSTGLSPLLAARVRRNVALARRAGPQRERLAALSARLCGALRALGYRVPDASHGPVVPVLVGPSRTALELS
ncbi:MAG TPA: aminotransferase class I/II-fold pyridoxal phosphate-dependent enzyme, partial [Polyangiaceae bacterium]|nr:aminotransferase class I/II-fold pyridoxal phosphate-dependent enzyme [Polyangiaceae bacterium]